MPSVDRTAYADLTGCDDQSRAGTPHLPRPPRVSAIRFGGAPMTGALDLRSIALRHAARDLPPLEADSACGIERARAAMFAMVPAMEKPDRQRLIAAQRALQRGDFDAADRGRGLDALVDLRLTEARAAHQRLAAVHRRAEMALQAEMHRIWKRLCAHPLLRAAIVDSSPVLHAALRRDGAAQPGDAERLRRSVTGYATKLTTKANLLHVFGRLAISGADSVEHRRGTLARATDFYEFMEERTPAPTDQHEGGGWAVAPIVSEDERGYVMLLLRDGALALARVPRSPMLEALLACTAPDDRLLSYRTVHATLGELTGSPDEAVTGQAVARFAHAGVLVTVTPPPPYRTRLGGRHALRRRARSPQAGWVNAYTPFPATSSIGAAVGAALPILRRVIRADDTFADRRVLIRAWLRAELARRTPAQVVPYVSLLSEFAAQFGHIVSASVAVEALAGQRAVRAERERVARALHGELSPSELGTALGVHDTTPDDLDAGRPIVAIGPYSVRQDRFFPQQYLWGDDRFLGRFLVERRRVVRRDEADDGVLDVELAPAPPPALHRVIPTFATGTGFDARCRRDFRTWIEPEDIAVTLIDGQVTWIRQSDRRPLRLQYRGSALSEFLPAHLQLLLIEQVDRYENPFAASPRDSVRLEAVPALAVAGVVLRRATWFVPVRTFSEIWPERLDRVRALLDARRRLQALLGVDEDCWYVQLHGASARRDSHKPRYVDLLAPDTMRALAHLVARAEPTSVIGFTRMEPGRDEVITTSGGVVQEWMVEL